MTCSLEIYRSNIGSFYPSYRIKQKLGTNIKGNFNRTCSLLVLLVIQCLCMYVGSSGADFKSTNIVGDEYIQFCEKSMILTRKQHNKVMHSLMGNRQGRRTGIKCMYWNKGPSLLQNKQIEIGTLINEHKPHVFGLGEANLGHDQPVGDINQPDMCIQDVQQPDYDCILILVYTIRI